MINHENISFRIFEYHEGILDASQKAELMEYLHQNPELNHDFAIWAQVRLHDEPIERPELIRKLLKPEDTFAHWSFVSIRAIETIILISISIFILNNTTVNKNLPESHLQNQTKFSKAIENVSSAKNVQKDTLVRKIAHSTISKRDKNQISSTSILLFAPKSLDSTQTPKQDLSDSMLEVVKPVTLQDSVLSKKEKTIAETENDQVKPNQNKYPNKIRQAKQKISFKPTSDILPQGTDF